MKVAHKYWFGVCATFYLGNLEAIILLQGDRQILFEGWRFEALVTEPWYVLPATFLLCSDNSGQEKADLEKFYDLNYHIFNF